MTNLVSLDLGKAYTKGVTSKKDVSFPSAVAQDYGDAIAEFGGFGTDAETTIQTGELSAAVGDSAYRLSSHQRSVTRRAQLFTDDHYLLYLAALGALYPSRGGDVEIVASIPGGWWTRQKELEDMIVGHHSFEYCGTNLSFDVADVTVIPEGFGTLAYFVLSVDGQKFIDRRMAEGRIALIDVGGRTTDILGFDKLHLLANTVDSRDLGIIDIRERLQKSLASELDRGTGTLTDDIIDATILSRQITHAGQRIDVAHLVDPAVGELAQNVYDLFAQKLDGGVAFDTVLLTGGGAPLIGPHLALDHADVRWPDKDSHMANAVGGFRYGLFRRAYVGVGG